MGWQTILLTKIRVNVNSRYKNRIKGLYRGSALSVILSPMVKLKRNFSYLARVIRLIVGNLDFFKTSHLFPKLIKTERTIRMRIETMRWSRVCFASHQPLWSVIGVSVSLVVSWNDIKEDMELCRWSETCAYHLVNVCKCTSDSGKHSSTSSCDDHFCSKLWKYQFCLKMKSFYFLDIFKISKILCIRWNVS